MADPSTCLPRTPESILETHKRIKPYIHQTPVLTCRSLDAIASHPTPVSFLSNDPPSVWEEPSQEAGTSHPKFKLYFKMESTQLIGAFKARGAFSAITHLAASSGDGGIGLAALRERGVITHSSGNHAQALALAASTFNIPCTIVMPKISTPSKISGTKNTPGVRVVFSGSTAPEREEMVRRVIAEEIEKKGGGDGTQGPILVPPYDHPDILLGQGTAGLELERQYGELKRATKESQGRKACSFAVRAEETAGSRNDVASNGFDVHDGQSGEGRLDAVITPLGGGGLLSGTATWFSHTHNSSDTGKKKTLLFGAEPRFQGGNDGEVGLSRSPPERVPHVSTLTIADGLRTPVGLIPWEIISDKEKVQGVYSVTELQIKMALKLVLERMKVVIEPSSAVPLAVVLFNKEFRNFVVRKQKESGRGVWDLGIVVSGGNTTVDALSKLFKEGWLDEVQEDQTSEGNKDVKFEVEREAGLVGTDGKKVAEDVAG